MDIVNQRKLEWLRRLVVVGGFVLTVIGLVMLSALDNMTRGVAVLTLMTATGVFISAIGTASIRYRKWVLSVEERLAQLENASTAKAEAD